MGVSQPKQQHKPMDLEEWDVVPSSRDSHRILRNRFNSREIEEYTVTLSSSSEISDYQDVFNWRLASDCLVSSINFAVLDSVGHCGSLYNLLLYLERIKDRFHQLKRLSEEDAVYALQCALQGFHEIYKKFGYVDVEQSMLCVNSQNQVKIWISEDLASHKPWAPYMTNRTEQDMVKNIVSIIDGKMGNQHTLRDFINSVCPNLRFKEVKLLLLMFMKQRSIQHQFHLKFADYNPKTSTSHSISYQANYKSSLSRLLFYNNQQDKVSEKPKKKSVLLDSAQKFDLQRKAAMEAYPILKAPTEQFTTTCTTNMHIRQQSGLTVAESQQVKNTESSPTEVPEKGAETVLSGVSAPNKLSSIVQTLKEFHQSSVLIPKLPLSRRNSPIPKPPSINLVSLSKTPTPGSASGATPKSSCKQVNLSKVSITHIKKKLTPEDIKKQLKQIRRTYSICVTSRKAIIPPIDLNRYHASQLVEPKPGQIISYEIMTSLDTDEGQRGSRIQSKII